MHASNNFLKGVAFLAMLLPSACSPTTQPLTKREPSCMEVVIPVTISASNIWMEPTTTFQQALDITTQINLDLVTNLLSSVVSFLFNELVQGTFDIAGTYCEPPNPVDSRANTLQFLMHGATYDRNYWSGDGPPGSGYSNDTYSWVAYASQQGFPTFAIDRLGSGASSQPDPILIVQCPTQVEIAHQIITMARNGVSPFPRKFTKIIVAGHSLGSVITQSLSVKYPNDANAIILTGYSKYIINFLPGIFVTGALLPAAVVQPQKYGYLPIGYLEPDSFSGIEYLFWYGPDANGTQYFDPKFPAYDYALRHAITIGEGASGAVAAATAYGYTGDVLTITGQQDTLFCGTNALPIDGPGQCVGGPLNYLAGTADLYPKAHYWWWNVPDAGHCWHFHYSAQQGFNVVHEWLADRGF